MKLQYKIALMIFGLGSLSLVGVASVSYMHNRSQYIQHLHIDLRDAARERAAHVEMELKKKAGEARMLSGTPLIVEALARSNAEYASMTEDERQGKISRLNDRWMETAEASDPFVQSYMANPVAGFLKEHMERNPGEYGEIFLTNRYGSIIATTEKLTTLAHAHKYWWIAAFAEGKGRVFFDDRGFDSSVKGYVTGVVAPVMKDGEIIGILKCNVNISDILLETIEGLKLGETGHLKIARSGGRIVLEKDKEPLSTELPPVIVEGMKKRSEGSIVIEDGEETLLTAYVPISITAGSAEYAFGGKYESIDHIMGNRGELWYALLSQDLDEALFPLRESWRAGLFVGLLTLVLMGLFSMFFGRRMALPVMRMERLARRVGEGDFDAQMDVRSRDELGHLAGALNAMTMNLRVATSSRDQAEDALKKVHEELEIRVEERSFELAKANLELQMEITERKEVENSLRSLEKAVETMQLGVTICDAEGKIVYTNPADAKMHGYKVEELIGKEARIFAPSETWRPVPLEEIEKTGSRSGESFNITKDGRIFPVHLICDVVMDGSGEPAAIVTSCEDITERKRIDMELEESREQMRSLALHLQTVRESERIRIARDIHDELGQILSVFKLDFSWINKRLREDQKPLIGKIKEVSELVDGAIDSVQRICSELRPTLLDDVGIVAGIEWQAEELQKRTGIECKLSLETEGISLDKHVSIDIFRIFQEALTNIARHAGATRIDASLKVDNDKLILEIRDNGRGIREDEILGSKSFGLMGMRERVYSWGGELHISGIAGKGTTILVSVPLDEKGGFR